MSFDHFKIFDTYTNLEIKNPEKSPIKGFISFLAFILMILVGLSVMTIQYFYPSVRNIVYLNNVNKAQSNAFGITVILTNIDTTVEEFDYNDVYKNCEFKFKYCELCELKSKVKSDKKKQIELIFDIKIERKTTLKVHLLGLEYYCTNDVQLVNFKGTIDIKDKNKLL